MHREEKMREINTHKKYTELQNTRIYRILFWISEMLQKVMIVYLFHVGGGSSVHLKVNVVEDLISLVLKTTLLGQQR